MAMTTALNEFDSRKNKENSQKIYTDIMTALRLENYPAGIKISRISRIIYRSEYITALQTLINACDTNNIELSIDRGTNQCRISTNSDNFDLEVFEKYTTKEYNKIRGKYTNAKAYYEELTKDLREKSSSIPSDNLNPEEQIMLIDELKSEGKKIENEELIRKWAEKMDDLQSKFFKIKGIKLLFDNTTKTIKECAHNLIFIPLRIEWSREWVGKQPKDTEGHANIIIIDKHKRTIELYESNYICPDLDLVVDKRQETASKFVKIFGRHLKLRYSAPCDICTLTGLQIFGDSLNVKEFHPKKEPDGYCQAYSLLWLALRSIYYDMNKTELHRMMETMNKTHIRALIKNFAYTLLLKADRIGYSSSSMDIDSGKSLQEILEEIKEKKRKISENIKATKPEVDILAANMKKIRIAGAKRKSKK